MATTLAPDSGCLSAGGSLLAVQPKRARCIPLKSGHLAMSPKLVVEAPLSKQEQSVSVA